MTEDIQYTPTVLSIAGSDPSAGAGIQADLKTMTSVGVYGAAAITCMTVQNSRGVKQIIPVPPDFIAEQIAAVLTDHNVTHIKIGMTGSIEIIETVAESLRSFSGEVILDPVMSASTGESLFSQDGPQILLSRLLPRVTFLTPNISELESLTKKQISTPEEAIESARKLLSLYKTMKGLVIKGGHLEMQNSTITDFLIQTDGETSLSERQRIQNRNLHGTGCTYASAFASYLCLGNQPPTAFQLAGKYMDTVIRAGAKLSIVKSGSNGPLLHHRFS